MNKILKQNEWPEGATADGRLYSLESSMNMKDAGKLDEEGRLYFVPVVPESVTDDVSEQVETFVGTYAEVAERAEYINGTQMRLHGSLNFIFHPSPIEPQAAR